MKMWKKMKKDVEAISPVVATLLLVLVAVASVTAFYLWQSSWQGSVQNKVGDAGIDTGKNLVIGGSTTVYDFMTIASEKFMQNNTQYHVTVQAGGSGAGLASAASGAVNIGMSSASMTAAQKAQYPNLVETVIAKDGVCVVISNQNTHGLLSMNSTVLSSIYKANTGVTFTAPAWLPVNTTASDAAHGLGKYTWNDIPSKAGVMGGAQHCNGTAVINCYDRADVSGTEEMFGQIVFGSKKQLEDSSIGVSNAIHENGNPALVSAIANDKDGIGFAPYGFINTASGIQQLARGYQAVGQSSVQICSVSNIKDYSYAGARPLEVVTNGAPTGSVKTFIDFCLTPGVNTEICADTGFVSIYQ